MIEIVGKYNTAKVFTDNIEETAYAQLLNMCNQEFMAGSKIRVMPDVHAGAGCTIGTTMTVGDKIVPNMVGVDIGCGVTAVKLSADSINLDNLDKIIRQVIPMGRNVRDSALFGDDYRPLRSLHCKEHVDLNRAVLSIGTLGGGKSDCLRAG